MPWSPTTHSTERQRALPSAACSTVRPGTGAQPTAATGPSIWAPVVPRSTNGGAREEGLEQTAEKGPGDAVGGREHGGVWTGAGFRPKPLGAKSLSCSSAISPETRASLETPVSVSHPHLVSGSTNTPCAQPWAGLGWAVWGTQWWPQHPWSCPPRTHRPVGQRDPGGQSWDGIPGHTWPSLRTLEGCLEEEELLGR